MTETVQTAHALDMEALTQRCLGNSALIDRVLKRFAKQLDADLQELERALQSSDLTAFALVSHRIKGMSANVEARELRRLATQAEELAVQQQFAQLVQILPELQAERDRISASLSL